MMNQQPKSLLVTVGTTQFDALIQFTTSSQFQSILKEINLQNIDITYQIGGKGKIIPEKGSYFRLSQNIQQVYESHQIIITHGGAGTLLYCLNHGKQYRKIIGVANDTLAGNHQTQLITKLDSQNYLLGFNSLAQMKNSRQKIIKYLKGQHKCKQYKRNQLCILNNLVFGGKKQ